MLLLAVSVFARSFGPLKGYDVVVNKKTATVQDYLNAVNHAFQHMDLARERSLKQDCRGCDLCCAERIPLTIIDCLSLCKAAKTLSLSGFLQRFATVSVTGPVVDITLRLLNDGYCVFLDRKTRMCRVYPVRPFVCQSFRCCPATKRAVALREAIVNKGEDELVRRWLKTRRVIHCADKPSVNVRDWPKTPFSGKRRYDMVPLLTVVPKGLWGELYIPGKFYE